jgi:PAS domain-containing protein
MPSSARPVPGGAGLSKLQDTAEADLLLVVTGPDGLIERFNGMAAKALGLLPEHVAVTRLTELCAGFSEAFDATFRDVCRTQQEATLRACLAIAGGQPHWYEWTLRPTLGHDGTLQRVMCAGRDLASMGGILVNGPVVSG